MGLTDKQSRFVSEYLIDLNATQAAIRAGYSKKTAQIIGSENLSKPLVAEAISAAQAALAEKADIRKDAIVAELARIAFTDIRKAVRWGRSPVDETSKNADPNAIGIYPVSLIPSEEVDDDTAAAISEVSLTQTGVRIKMHDKKAALVDLAKMLGYVAERHEHTGPNGRPLDMTITYRKWEPPEDDGPSEP